MGGSSEKKTYEYGEGGFGGGDLGERGGGVLMTVFLLDSNLSPWKLSDSTMTSLLGRMRVLARFRKPSTNSLNLVSLSFGGFEGS